MLAIDGPIDIVHDLNKKSPDKQKACDACEA